MNKEQKTEILETYYKLHEKKSDLDKKFAALKKEIKSEVGAGQYGDYVVAYEDGTNTRFDWKACKDQMPKLWAQIEIFLTTKETEPKLIVVKK